MRLLSLTESSDPARVDTVVRYTATVDNAGPLTSADAQLFVFIPPGATLDGIAATQGTCAFDDWNTTDTTASCKLGALAVGANATMSFGLRFASAQTYEVRVSAVPVGLDDPNTVDNLLSETTSVIGDPPPPPPPPPPPSGADVQVVSLSDSKDPVREGDKVFYTAVVTNAGPSAASAVNLAATLPSGAKLHHVESSQGSCAHKEPVCNLGNLGVGQKATMTFTVKLRNPGTNVTRVDAVAPETDPDTANNTRAQTTEVKKKH